MPHAAPSRWRNKEVTGSEIDRGVTVFDDGDAPRYDETDLVVAGARVAAKLPGVASQTPVSTPGCPAHNASEASARSAVNAVGFAEKAPIAADAAERRTSVDMSNRLSMCSVKP